VTAGGGAADAGFCTFSPQPANRTSVAIIAARKGVEVGMVSPLNPAIASRWYIAPARDCTRRRLPAMATAHAGAAANTGAAISHTGECRASIGLAHLPHKSKGELRGARRAKPGEPGQLRCARAQMHRTIAAPASLRRSRRSRIRTPWFPVRTGRQPLRCR
jgi:hypothetical protein